ncbi:Spy/CpxP family protein refolding chaperone [Sunxiuqinia elliptica]
MFTKTKILMWLVIILLVTNISTIISFIYHSQEEHKLPAKTESIAVPGEQRTRFFKEQLDLTADQLVLFREANRNFNREARAVTGEMEQLRAELVAEMVRAESDTARLEQISTLIGAQHKQLKTITYAFFLDLKAICSPEQNEKLARIFQSLISADQDIQLPKGRKHRNGRR